MFLRYFIIFSAFLKVVGVVVAQGPKINGLPHMTLRARAGLGLWTLACSIYDFIILIGLNCLHVSRRYKVLYRS